MPAPIITIRPASRPIYRKLARHAARATDAIRSLFALYGDYFEDEGVAELRRCYEPLARLRDDAEYELEASRPKRRR